MRNYYLVVARTIYEEHYNVEADSEEMAAEKIMAGMIEPTTATPDTAPSIFSVVEVDEDNVRKC